MSSKLESVFKRLEEDLQFREELKKDPKKILSQEFGIQITASKVHVIEPSPNTIYILIPTKEHLTSLEENAREAPDSKFVSLVIKALKDPTFKSALKNNPKEVFEREVCEVPDTISIQVLEDSGDEIFLLIPQPKEITEIEQLVSITGGSWKVAPGVVASIAMGTWGKITGDYGPLRSIGSWMDRPGFF